MKRTFVRTVCLLVSLLLIPLLRAESQSEEQQLLLRISNLRGGLGLSPYVWNGSLAQAAANHASWLSTTNFDCRATDCHRQSDGSYAADRARRYGYGGERVHENFYRGADESVESAWRFWLGSSVHYNNLTSALLSEIGIGRASAGGRTAYVLVFGQDSGRGAPQAGNSSATGSAGGRGQPTYVLGLDEAGNIRHEVQPGHTIGDIALIYGYTWDDIPAMLELNGMTAADIRRLQPGSEFLVPPRDGTFTPTSPPPSITATALPTTAATKIPAATPSAKPLESDVRIATLVIRISAIATEVPKQQGPEVTDGTSSAAAVTQLAVLGAAILCQLGILAGAGIALWGRSR